MKRLLYAIVCLLALASCDNGPTRPPLTDNPDYFPLQVGNQWSYFVYTADSKGYYSFAYNERCEITGDSLFQGKKYYVMQTYVKGQGTTNTYLSKDSEGNVNCLTSIIPKTFGDTIYQKVIYFNKPLNEYWLTYNNLEGKLSKITSKVDTTTVAPGVFFPNYVIQTDDSSGTAFATVFAPNVGIITIRPVTAGYGLKKTLGYARINGVNYQ